MIASSLSMSRRVRRSLLAAVLVVPVLVGVLAAPAAAAPVRAGDVTHVTGVVDADSRLYHLSMTFQLENVTCPAVLDYQMNAREYIGLNVCTTPGFLPTTTVTHQFPVFAHSSDLVPDTDYRVSAFVRASSSLFDNVFELGLPNTVGGQNTPELVHAPPAPVWVGVGDGYTSQRMQFDNTCYVPSDACGTWRNLSDASWVWSAVSDFNSSYYFDDGTGDPVSIPNAWQVQAAVVAKDDVTAASLQATPSAPNGTSSQINDMLAVLSQHTGSWNWVGLSAGFLDAGIQQAIWNAYPKTGTAPADGTNYNPTGARDLWNVQTASQCPILPSAVASPAPIKAGIENAIAKAQAASPGVRVLVTKYPYLTEVQGTVTRAGQTNPCAPANRNIINSLNGVVQSAINTFAPANGAEPDVFAMDLATAFGAEPTGTNGDVQEDNSALQLTRPWGYPYPSSLGQMLMSQSALDAALSSGTAQAPTLDVAVVNKTTGAVAPGITSPAGGIWFNAPNLAVEFKVGDPGAGGAYVSQVCWEQRGGFNGRPGIAAGCQDQTAGETFRVDLLEARDLRYTGTVVASDGQSSQRSIDVSFDRTVPVITATRPAATGGGGWYVPADLVAGSLNVGFSIADGLPPTTGDPLDASGPNASTLAISSVTPTTGRTITGTNVSITASGTYNITATGRDNVGNVAGTTTDVVRVDITKPSSLSVLGNGVALLPTYLLSAGLPALTCAVTDAHSGSGGCTITPSATNPTSGIGTYSFTVTGRDVAGNVADPITVSLQLINTPPVTHIKDGRMNGGGTFGTGGVKVAFTLRCNGRPDMIDVFFDKPAPAPVPAPPAGTSASAWKAFLEWLADQYGSSGFSAQTNNGNGHGNGNGHDDDDDGQLRFTMTQVTSELCTDTSANPGQPKSPFDTYSGTGVGKLSDGRTATIEWSFTDAGEPGKNDTAKIVIKVGSTVILSAGPAKLTEGNFQAMYAQGNGANNWDDRDDNYSGAGWKWKDKWGSHEVDYGRSGCSYKRETSKRYHYEDDDRYGNRRSRDDYKRR